MVEQISETAPGIAVDDEMKTENPENQRHLARIIRIKKAISELTLAVTDGPTFADSERERIRKSERVRLAIIHYDASVYPIGVTGASALASAKVITWGRDEAGNVTYHELPQANA